ncbi:hypothetical protein C8F04DRAFT_1341690 [Mycena alexandri]|uniref:Uncharacterized protein n=1 Tax=Mycena alexandri TaxID=1745969 RepID=A0AAD6X5K5_9AGAR|nr:hypothetical protein C8F04DRAFT_1341690 [Mycena alexandri]
MPEKGVLLLFEREVQWEERQQPVSVDRGDDNVFMGDFIIHPACCADPEGTRQTFTLHISSPADAKFVELPRLPAPPPAPAPTSVEKKGKKKGKKTQQSDPPSHYCKSCYRASSVDNVDISSNQNSVTEHENTSPAPLVDKNMPTTEFVSSLKIHGRISAKARGKELVVAICNSNTGENIVFRIAFGLEAHCFWIPIEWCRQIVSAPTVPRGSKSQAYAVPDEYIEGPATDRLISIQAAFIRPEYTLLFVDHNVMIQFHLMQTRAAFTSRDLVPTSEFWSCLWSGNHGPVYSLEPEATLRAIDEWRLRILAHPDDLTSIFMAMKEDQSVFNGSGAQEATDQLLCAFISPQMPALYICMHDMVWARFRKVFVEYDATRMALVLPDAKLPYVSGNSPLRMNNSGHTKYLHHIDSYRRKACTLNVDELKIGHDLGLFIPNAVIQPDGHAEVPSGISPALPTVPTVLRSDRGQGQKTVRVPNIAITMAGNGSGRTSYSPFTAQPGSDWISARREKVLSDVKADVNDTTLGLYSFRIFVDCVWSVQKLKGTPLPRGPRPLVTIGQSNRKRPLAEEIAKTAAPKKRRISLDLIENVDLGAADDRILTRSQRKLL